jgi:hypothetical protein
MDKANETRFSSNFQVQPPSILNCGGYFGIVVRLHVHLNYIIIKLTCLRRLKQNSNYHYGPFVENDRVGPHIK